MKQWRRADAARLTDQDVKTIIATRGTIPNAARQLAARYRVSITRVYQIWRDGGDAAAVPGKTHSKAASKTKHGGQPAGPSAGHATDAVAEYRRQVARLHNPPT